MQVEKQVFLITGGASGLGKATAGRLAAAGARVMIADIDEELGREAAAGIGDAAASVVTDVTSSESVTRAIESSLSHFGILQGVVNCAGIAIGQRVVARSGVHDLDAFRRVVEVNLVGSFNVIRLAAAAMIKPEREPGAERGVIINTASVAAFDGQIGQAAYAASKAGIVGMILPIARELAAFGIRVVGIAPGIFDTPMMAGMPEKVRASLAEQVPFPSRLGRPSEFAALVEHICRNEMLNGEIIRLDGGIRMAPR